MRIVTPEELIAEEKELQEDKKIYPPFLVEEFRKCREEIRIEEKTGKSIPFEPTKITDFTVLITNIWKISNRDYQERFWVRQELPMRGDNFMETTMTFNQHVRGVSEAKDLGLVKMDEKQYEMLMKLYNMIDEFEADPDTPPDPGYGENDKEIVADPRWDKIRNFAKEVYEELIKEG